jgi:hypothetical protein
MLYKFLRRLWPNLFGWREYRTEQAYLWQLNLSGHDIGSVNGHLFHYASCRKCAARFGEPVELDPAKLTFTMSRDRAWEQPAVKDGDNV